MSLNVKYFYDCKAQERRIIAREFIALQDNDSDLLDHAFRNVHNLPHGWKHDNLIIGKDKNGHVTTISLQNRQLSGTVDLSATLPPTLVALDLARNQLSGDLHLADLPTPLKRLNLSHNAFSSVVFAPLPPSLDRLDLSFNKLSGNLADILDAGVTRRTWYSSGWTSLVFDHNNFTGSLAPLSPWLNSLSVTHNDLSGTVLRKCVKTEDNTRYAAGNKNLLVLDQTEYDHAMTDAVMTLRCAKTSRCGVEDGMAIWAVAQQVLNFLTTCPQSVE